MGFAKGELSPVMNKIVCLLNDKDKIPVDEFRSEICRLRINRDEADEIEKYLSAKGYIIRRGKTIVIL